MNYLLHFALDDALLVTEVETVLLGLKQYQRTISYVVFWSKKVLIVHHLLDDQYISTKLISGYLMVSIRYDCIVITLEIFCINNIVSRIVLVYIFLSALCSNDITIETQIYMNIDFIAICYRALYTGWIICCCTRCY